MTTFSRHLSPRGITGLAMTCAAMAVVSWIGDRSTARLTVEQLRNQSEIAETQKQIAALNRLLESQTLIFERDSALADSVSASPLSRVLAETSAKLSTESCLQRIEIGPDRTARIEIDSPGRATFDLRQWLEASAFQFDLKSVAHRCSPLPRPVLNRSSAGALSVAPTLRPTVSEIVTNAN